MKRMGNKYRSIQKAKKSVQSNWLESYKRFRRHIRWLSGVILVLGLTALFDGQEMYEQN